jgi:hypothetical protein
MNPRLRALLVLPALLLATVARADAPTALDRLLLEPRPAAALRARLAEHARALDGTQRYEAARARLMLGRSALRAGLADSAVAALARAADDRGTLEDVVTLADALLARGRAGDALTARARVESALAGTEAAGERGLLLPRLALALERLGRADSARAVWRATPPGRALTSLARRRALALGRSDDADDRAAASEALLRFVMASRGTDADAMHAMLVPPAPPDAEARLRTGIAGLARTADATEAARLTAFGASATRVTGADGMPLAGAVRAPLGVRRPGAAVVLMSPDEPFEAADSLVATLARAGFATLLLRPRACGASVSAVWPGAWCLEERPEAWIAAAARDVPAAARTLARITRCDTTRVLLVASGPLVAVAARAAALDRRVSALVLASPVSEEAARPPLLDDVARRAPAVFVQMTAEDQFGSSMLADALFHAGAIGHARLSEAMVAGSGLAAWRDDAPSRERLTRWLAEPLPPARPVPRPPARR